MEKLASVLAGAYRRQQRLSTSFEIHPYYMSDSRPNEDCDTPKLVEHAHCNYALSNGLEMSGLPSCTWSCPEITRRLERSVNFGFQGVLLRDEGLSDATI